MSEAPAGKAMATTSQVEAGSVRKPSLNPRRSDGVMLPFGNSSSKRYSAFGVRLNAVKVMVRDELMIGSGVWTPNEAA